MHLAKPVEVPIEGKLLENAEDADKKHEHHSKPNEAAPNLESPEGLDRKKDEEQIGDKEEEFHSRVVGRRGAMKKPLAASDQRKNCQRWNKRRKNNLFLMSEINPQCPGEKEESSARLQDGPGPIFDTSVRGNGKHNQSPNTQAQQPHGLGCSPDAVSNPTTTTPPLPSTL